MQTNTNRNRPILFRTNSDRRFYKSVHLLYTLAATLCGIALFSLLLSLIAAGGSLRTVAEARDPVPTACLMTGLLFLLISLFALLLARRQGQLVARLLSCNFVVVYEGYFYGKCMASHPNTAPVSFDLPASAITHITVEKEPIRLLFWEEETESICLHTANKMYRILFIKDVSMAVMHLSYFLQK